MNREISEFVRRAYLLCIDNIDDQSERKRAQAQLHEAAFLYLVEVSTATDLVRRVEDILYYFDIEDVANADIPLPSPEALIEDHVDEEIATKLRDVYWDIAGIKADDVYAWALAALQANCLLFLARVLDSDDFLRSCETIARRYALADDIGELAFPQGE